MKTISKLVALILVIVLSASLVACDNEKENKATTKTPTTVETEQVTQESTQAEIDYENLVVDAVFEELTDPYDSHSCYYHIPKVNLSNGLADEINEKMLNDGREFMADAYESIDKDVSIISSGYNYLWGYKDNVVSVLAAKYYNMPGFGYNVYNLNMETGEILLNDDLRKFYGLSEQELTDLIINKAAARFEEKYKHMEDSLPDLYNKQYENTVTEENANRSLLYINKDGDLCSVTTIYSLAGADAYSHVLNLTGDTSAEDPDVMS